jgi:hypothetical protein
MSTKKPDLVTPLDPEPGQCCQHLREEVALLESRVQAQQATIREREELLMRAHNALEGARQRYAELDGHVARLQARQQAMEPPDAVLLADMLARWLRLYKDGRILGGDELEFVTRQALEQFYGVHEPKGGQ